MAPSPITPNQWQKVLKALYYSTASGFVVGFTTAITSVLTAIQNGGSVNAGKALVVGLIVAGATGAVNAAAVTVKQLFSQE